LFLLLGVSVGLLCIPYPVIMALLTGSSETLTVTFRKTQSSSFAMSGREATLR
jgi:hypothetical protein